MSKSRFAPKNYPWAPSQDALIAKMWHAGNTSLEIAQALNDPEISRSMVLNRRVSLKLPKRVGEQFKWTEKQMEALRFMWRDQSLTVADMADKIGCNRNTVSAMADRLGLPDRRKKSAFVTSKPKAPPSVFASGPIPLPQRKTATPIPDVEAWQAQQGASRERLEADGGNCVQYAYGGPRG